MSNLHLTVASWSDRDDLVIELTVEEGAAAEDWGLVTYDQASGAAVLDLYPRANGEDWRFDLEEACALLGRAQRRIQEVAGPIAADEQRSDVASEAASGGQGN